MRILTLSACAVAALSLAACGDNRTDDVVQVPTEGAAPMEVTNQQADVATTQTAIALGMTQKQLEDSDLVTPAGVDLGDVDQLIMDAGGKVTHLVVELDGPGDVKVQVPLDKVAAYTHPNGTVEDLSTTLTMQQLAALPRWTPPAR